MPSKRSAVPLSATEQGGIVPGSIEEVVGKLDAIYHQHIKPLEDMYNYEVFRPSFFEDSIRNLRPLVTLFGPWSSGKSTLINYLLQGNHMWTGPQPTTASFTAVVYGTQAGPLDGRVLANSKKFPFKGLNAFGESFLQNFQGFQVPHPLLERVTLIDTPGVLEGAKDVHQRSYDYMQVTRWFVERSDLIFFLFDPTKLDTGTELRTMFSEAFKGHEGKLRIILNKADTVDAQALMRVYGSVFWNLSNIIRTTEPPRVFVGSLWDKPYKDGTFTLLFSKEKRDLLYELIEVVPQQARDRKIALVIRRAKDVLAHAVIVGSTKSALPALFGKDKARRKALENLPQTYKVIACKYKLNPNDFPPVEEYRAFLDRLDFGKIPEIEKAEKKGLIAGVLNCIDSVLPGLLRPVRDHSQSGPHDAAQVEALMRRYEDSAQGQRAGRRTTQDTPDVPAPAGRQAAAERAPQVSAAPSLPGGQPVPVPPPQPRVSDAQQQAERASPNPRHTPATVTPSPSNRVPNVLEMPSVAAADRPTGVQSEGAVGRLSMTAGSVSPGSMRTASGAGGSSNAGEVSDDVKTEPAGILASRRDWSQTEKEQERLSIRPNHFATL